MGFYNIFQSIAIIFSGLSGLIHRKKKNKGKAVCCGTLRKEEAAQEKRKIRKSCVSRNAEEGEGSTGKEKNKEKLCVSER